MIHRLYCHLVWTTRERRPLIDAGLARFLCRFLHAVARQERAEILEVGMVATHLHLLVRIHPMTDLVRLVQRLKGGSSAMAAKERRAAGDHQLRWAKGYSIHSVSPRGIAAVREYLRAQPLQHPAEGIAGWGGDEPVYDATGTDEWRSDLRHRV